MNGLRKTLAIMLFSPIVPVLLGTFLFLFFPDTDPDYWWHVRTGRVIWEMRALPKVDIYSHTAAGRPWVMHEWLTELLLYWVQRHGGYIANELIFGVLAACTWGTVYRLCRLNGMGEPGAALLALWSFRMACGSVNVRPQVLTALFAALYALVIALYLRGERRWLWSLPPLMVLWVNLHGGYVIGLVLLGIALGSMLLERLRGQPSPPLKPALAVGALTLAATLLNPHGLAALAYPFSYAGVANASMRYISEWQSPDFHSLYFLLFAAALLLGCFVGVGPSSLGLTGTLWFLVLSLMGLLSVRHIMLFAIVGVPVLASRLVDMVPYLRKPLQEWQHPRLALAFWLVPVATIAIFLRQGNEPQFGREPSSRTYPAGAVEYLQGEQARGELFNAYAWGGYLIYKLYPQWPVFIDGRADVYGDALMDEYVKVSRLQEGWEEVLCRQGVRYALLAKDEPLAVALRDIPGWSLLYAGKEERLYFLEDVSRCAH
jgi:hypothetical protein